MTDILQVRSSLDYESTAAEVISRRITDQEHVISLDRGADAGIEVDDPVIGGGGALVGQVVEVGPNYSRVLLITDTRMNVVGLLESSRGVGTVHGNLDRPLSMDGISAQNQVNTGEAVVTAGIELSEGIRSPYPKGLLIGTVAGVSRSPDQLFQTALVTPAANFETLEYVHRDHQLPGRTAADLAGADLDALARAGQRPGYLGFFVWRRNAVARDQQLLTDLDPVRIGDVVKCLEVLEADAVQVGDVHEVVARLHHVNEWWRRHLDGRQRRGSMNGRE